MRKAKPVTVAELSRRDRGVHWPPLDRSRLVKAFALSAAPLRDFLPAPQALIATRARQCFKQLWRYLYLIEPSNWARWALARLSWVSITAFSFAS